MNKKNLYKANYDKLDISEKNEILNNIAAHYGFTIKNYAEFERNGISLYTAVYDDNGTEFVFIPGAKSVSLGFKASISYKNEDSAQIENLKDILLDYFLSPNVNSSLADSENTAQLQSYIEKHPEKGPFVRLNQ